MDVETKEKLIKMAKEAGVDQSIIGDAGQPSPYSLEYETNNPAFYKEVESLMLSGSLPFFKMYNRILKGYMLDQDSKFITDTLLHGIQQERLMKANTARVINALLVRTSAIRAILSITKEMPAEKTFKVYENTLTVWAASDTLELEYGGFIPTEVGVTISELETRAVDA